MIIHSLVMIVHNCTLFMRASSLWCVSKVYKTWEMDMNSFICQAQMKPLRPLNGKVTFITVHH